MIPPKEQSNAFDVFGLHSLHRASEWVSEQENVWRFGLCVPYTMKHARGLYMYDVREHDFLLSFFTCHNSPSLLSCQMWTWVIQREKSSLLNNCTSYKTIRVFRVALEKKICDLQKSILWTCFSSIKRFQIKVNGIFSTKNIKLHSEENCESFFEVEKKTRKLKCRINPHSPNTNQKVKLANCFKNRRIRRSYQ